jgi:hypothetical protein
MKSASFGKIEGSKLKGMRLNNSYFDLFAGSGGLLVGFYFRLQRRFGVCGVP